MVATRSAYQIGALIETRLLKVGELKVDIQENRILSMMASMYGRHSKGPQFDAQTRGKEGILSTNRRQHTRPQVRLVLVFLFALCQ